MNKPSKEINGKVLLPFCTGERASILSGDSVIHTSRVMAVREMSKKRVVIETMNTVYTVESDESDVCI